MIQSQLIVVKYSMEEFFLNYYGVSIIIIFLLTILFLINLYIKSKRKSNVAMAQVLNIELLFLKNEKYYEPYLNLSYQYKVKRKIYYGNTKILFSSFVEDQNLVSLYYNIDLDMPVLQMDQEIYIGNEAIEHKLMNAIPVIPIRYLISDPSRNFILPLNKKYGILNIKTKKIS